MGTSLRERCRTDGWKSIEGHGRRALPILCHHIKPARKKEDEGSAFTTAIVTAPATMSSDIKLGDTMTARANWIGDSFRLLPTRDNDRNFHLPYEKVRRKHADKSLRGTRPGIQKQQVPPPINLVLPLLCG